MNSESNWIIDAAERLSNLSGVELAFEYHNDLEEEDDDEEEDEDDEENEENGGAGNEDHGRPVYITREQIMQLLGTTGLGRIFASDFIATQRRGRRDPRMDRGDDDYENEETEESEPDTGYDGRTLRKRRPRGRAAFDKVPSERGIELMNAGTFGSHSRSEDTIKRKKTLAYDIMRRELGLGSQGRQANATRLLKQNMIPESVADTIIHYNARCYSGQFSDDGNFFFSCAQDFKVRMYDTSNPYDWKYYKVRPVVILNEIKIMLTYLRELITLTGSGQLQMPH